MTRKEAIRLLTTKRAQPSTDYQMAEVYTMAIKALDQEPILDKIRAEIEQTSETIDGFLMHDGTKKTVLKIIDKYKAERSVKE